VKVVLDASLALTWLLRDASEHDTAHAFDVLARIRAGELEAVVPVVWGLEIANAVLRAERQHRVDPQLLSDFLRLLAGMPIDDDTASTRHALTTIMPLAQRCRLSSYDAAYLELALRLVLPLATLDEDLRRAAGKVDVKIFRARKVQSG